MDLEAHKKSLGIFHLVYGILTSVVFLFVGSVASIMMPFIQDAIIDSEGQDAELVIGLVSGILRITFLVLFIFSALPSIIAGIGLISRRSWGVIISMIAGCVSLLNFPFGTVLGVYAIYVFIQNNNQATNEISEG